MDPITGGVALLSALKTSGSGGTSQIPSITAAAPSKSGDATSGGTNTATSGGGNASGVAFWVAIAAMATVIGYVIVKEF